MMAAKFSLLINTFWQIRRQFVVLDQKIFVAKILFNMKVYVVREASLDHVSVFI